METFVYEELYQDHTIKIYHDRDAENPREYDNLGTMICGHSRYQLGDKHSFSSGRDLLIDLLNLTDDRRLSVDDLLKRVAKIAVILPVYLMDHSGLSLNTTGFSCPWDSGQVGFIYVLLADIRHEYSVKQVSPKLRKQVETCLKNEVEIFSEYISGEVYGYTVEKQGEEIDSCWGFIGNYEDFCLKEARAAVA